MPKIIIKPRLAQSDETDDANSAAEDVEDQVEDAVQDVVNEPATARRGRGRGSSRAGRPPLPTTTPSSSVRGTRGRGRPRGRPRAAAAAAALTIRLPKTRPEDNDEDDQVPTEVEPDEPPAAAPGQEIDPAQQPKSDRAGSNRPLRKVLGQSFYIEGDEFVTDNDPKGDTKIDEWGNLLDGRKFKAGTFILPNRHDKRRYMLAIDAARTSGFRDSLYYFRRNPLALKLNATQAEKEYLIQEGKLGPHLKTRSVTLVTAKSAFKLHGSKTILDGRWVIDDYYEDKVLEEITERGLKAGDPVGELADPNAPNASSDSLPVASSRNDRASAISGGGGGMYRAGGPTTIFGPSGWGPYSDGPLNAVRKSLLSRDGVTEENWMFKMATKVLESGDEWSRLRREALRPDAASELEAADVDSSAPFGVYEPHIGEVLFRSDTQPTRSRTEALTDKPRILGGTKVGNGGWSIAWVDTIMEFTSDDTTRDRQRFVQGIQADPTSVILQV